jgi:hypothetical protein
MYNIREQLLEIMRQNIHASIAINRRIKKEEKMDGISSNEDEYKENPVVALKRKGNTKRKYQTSHSKRRKRNILSDTN